MSKTIDPVDVKKAVESGQLKVFIKYLFDGVAHTSHIMLRDVETSDTVELGNKPTVAIEKLAYYKNLEKQGRLIELPCAVGDIVWTIVRQRDSYDDSEYWLATQTRFKLEHLPLLGAWIFLTQEEAECAIKRLEK